MTQNDNTTYLTRDQVMTINTVLIKKYSPDAQTGIKSPELLDAALSRPSRKNGDTESYPTIEGKAAALIDSLAKIKPFHSANKQTALASLIVFLKLNGYKWTMNTEEETKFLEDLVENFYPAPAVEQAVQKHCEVI